MSEWITDRRPTAEDTDSSGSVWTTYNGEVVPWSYDGIAEGTPWMPIEKPEPYVKQKRWGVLYSSAEGHCVFDTIHGGKFAYGLPTREAAEEIAAIYERVMP